uniref:Uncharacterized protein n=1 Tax=Neobodo designis TaxID=312471 RepID=A0A7S1M9Y8_NEODS|mmetsp:Transcript_36853/g.113761  ORF Transcript_36853/g.113761 Transcript_36853/m.113761 type:complete len:113 (+) Transcript_36853:82-420(+)
MPASSVAGSVAASVPPPAPRSCASSVAPSASGAGGRPIPSVAATRSRVSGAPTTTTVMQKRVDAVAQQLESERLARAKAEAELEATNRQLEALEKVLGLAAPPNLPSNRTSN